MLRLPAFSYISPRTLAEATARLAADGPDAVAIAGGTDLLPHMKRRQRCPAVVVGLRHLRELQGIRAVPGQGLTIGAGATLAQVASDPAIRETHPALARTVGMVATATIRQMGTIGGNLCIETRCTCFDLPLHTRNALGHCFKDGGALCLVAPRSPRCWAIASSDTAPLLIAIGARVRIVGASGERVISLRDLYRDDGLRPLALQPGEVLSEILLPPADGRQAVYRKVRRRGTIDFPVLGVAAAARFEPDGTVRDASIVLSAVASAPLVVAQAAHLLEGRRLEPETIRAAAVAAARPARPLENADLAAAWRKHLVRVTVERALREMGAARH